MFPHPKNAVVFIDQVHPYGLTQCESLVLFEHETSILCFDLPERPKIARDGRFAYRLWVALGIPGSKVFSTSLLVGTSDAGGGAYECHCFSPPSLCSLLPSEVA